MRNKGSLTVFDKMKTKKKRCISLALVLTVMAGTCFQSAPFVSKADNGVAVQAEEEGSGSVPTQDGSTFFDDIMKEIENDTTDTRHFTILEVVPDVSEGEFVYYTAQPELQAKMDALSASTKKYKDGKSFIDYVPGNLSSAEQANVNSSGVGQITNFGWSNFRVMYYSGDRLESVDGKAKVEVENIFMNYVLPEYAGVLEGKIDVLLKQANELTAEDVAKADLIYVSTKYHDGGTPEGFKLVEGTVSNSELLENGTRVFYTKNGNGFEKKDITYTTPSFNDYDYVKYGSSSDAIYKKKIEAGEYKIYNEKAQEIQYGEGSGYYISKDMSWSVAKALMDTSLTGKEVNGHIWQVPMIFDTSSVDSNVSYNGNVYRMETIIRSSVTEIIQDIDEGGIYDTVEGKYVSGYTVLSSMICDQFNIYTTNGVKTAALNAQYFGFTKGTSTLKVKDGNNFVDKTDVILDGGNWGSPSQFKEGDVANGNWADYLSYLYQHIQYYYGGQQSQYPNAEVFERILARYQNAFVTNGGNEPTVNFLSSYKFRQGNEQIRLDKHFYNYNGTGTLVPSNYTQTVTVADAQKLLEEAGIIESGATYRNTDILRYLLGVNKSNNSKKFDKGGLYMKILEIQPSNSFQFNTEDGKKTLAKAMGIDDSKLVNVGDAHVKANATGRYTVDEGYFCLDIDSYTTNTVNGLNTNFIDTYDMVYIGDNAGILKTSGLNDSELDGCLYTAYGDTVKVNQSLSGFLKSDFKADGYLNTSTTTRLPGNDLTQYKKNQLNAYAEAGNIVMVGNNLYKTQNTQKSSNMRKLLIRLVAAKDEAGNAVASLASNVFPYTQAYKVKDCFKTVNPIFETMTVTTGDGTERAADLTYTSGNANAAQNGVVNNVIDVDGAATLKFNAVLSNVDDTKDYTVLVVLDKNGDGIFNEVKTDDDTNEVFADKEVSGVDLKSGIVLTAELNEKYSGLFIWKVIVKEKNTTKDIRGEVSGSLAIRQTGTPKEINVLQVVPGSRSTTLGKNSHGNYNSWGDEITLLMAGYSQGKDDGTYITAADLRGSGATEQVLKDIYITTPGLYDMTWAEVTANNKITDFEKLLWQTYQSIGYKINVTAMTTDKFNDIVDNVDNIINYDMVVVGFGDVYAYSDVDETSSKALADYIAAGKALLFSHDNVSFSTLSEDKYRTNASTLAGDYWAPNISTKFRDLVGMNRYGVQNDKDPEDNGNIYVPVNAAGNKISEIQGLSMFTTLRSRTGGGDYPYTTSKPGFTDWEYTQKVAKLNDGQVTQYPFEIDEEISVAKTHNQYYQLDLEVPEVTNAEGNLSLDETQKVMVWYTLAGGSSGYLHDTDKDAANNYYIYSKGNVTYTGAGHATMLNSNGTATSMSELKLFVNTIVKAVAAGNFTPKITVTNGQLSSGEYNIYYADATTGGTITDDQYKALASDWEIDWYASDADLIDMLGKFKAAQIDWIGTDASGNPATLTVVTYGNKTLKCAEGQVFKLSDMLAGSSDGQKTVNAVGEAQYLEIIKSLYDRKSYFRITVEDSRGAKATMNVRFSSRQFFVLD